MMDNLNLETFQGLLNANFHLILNDSDELIFELVQVNDLGSTPRQEQFSLVFKGPLEPRLPQMIFKFRQDAIDELDLFIVPIKQENDGILYESIFNRFIENTG